MNVDHQLNQESAKQINIKPQLHNQPLNQEITVQGDYEIQKLIDQLIRCIRQKDFGGEMESI
jgi:hypothetical protein